ncbi:MAG: flagellar motor protein MotB [Planctomycetota bacterium]
MMAEQKKRGGRRNGKPHTEEEEKGESAPLWMISYADMITLLTLLFVLLFSIANVQKSKLEALAGALQKNYTILPTTRNAGPPPPNNRMRPPILQKRDLEQTGRSPGLKGRYVETTMVREGLRITIGGFVLFDEGAAVLKEEAKPELRTIAKVIDGYLNRIEIRGHAGDIPAAGSGFKGKWDLSWARGMVVADFLAREGKLNPQRFRVAACSGYDPQPRMVFKEYDEAQNRRVEIIVSEDHVSLTGERVPEQ